ncbi:hypothetical protein [Paraburkholderia sp. J8-2]|uniref:hypothetical protein n=1 Tax=Paraburkholderia sp. J8-2 TaxID=2805440 RepID=UPI002AB76924|nr:hypothetical protein [Paraburkholderia sp. J8-2]
MRSLHKAIFVAASLLTADLAYAGGGGGGSIVFDPTNFIENCMTAAQTLQSESYDLQQVIQTASVMQNTLKNTVNSVAGLTGIGSIGDVTSLKAQFNVDQSLISQLGGMSNFVGGVMNQYAADSSNGSATSYIQMLANQAAAHQQNATSLISNYTNMSNEMQKTIQTRASIAAQNSGALGTNDQIQVTNASLDNLAEINQASLQGLQTLVRQAGYDESRRAATVSNASDAAAAYQAATQQSVTNANKLQQATSILGY